MLVSSHLAATALEEICYAEVEAVSLGGDIVAAVAIEETKVVAETYANEILNIKGNTTANEDVEASVVGIVAIIVAGAKNFIFVL